jgi:hypothetical protein
MSWLEILAPFGHLFAVGRFDIARSLRRMTFNLLKKQSRRLAARPVLVISSLGWRVLAFWVALSPATARAASVMATEATSRQAPGLAWSLPFVALLLSIAILPLVPKASHWWERNASKLTVALALALVTCVPMAPTRMLQIISMSIMAFVHRHEVASANMNESASK